MNTHSSPPGKSSQPVAVSRLVRLFTLLLLGLCSFVARGQLSSGGSYGGTILLNQTNSWTFSANNGDRLVLRAGVLTSTNYFNPWLRLYNPSGVLIADGGSGNSGVEELAVTATNNGTFTVTVCDTSYGAFVGTGQYSLYFARFPSSFSVPSGDDGGSLSSGNYYDGTIEMGDLDLWSFTATTGDRIVLRFGELTYTGYFAPWVRIYNPSGVLVADTGSGSYVLADELALTITNNGTYTVLVTDSSYGGFDGTGTYRLYFAQLPGAFAVPSGDDGGSLSSGNNYDGTIEMGDLDLWSFTATTGDRIVLRFGELTYTGYFNPWVRIYNPSGVLVADSGSGSSAAADEVALTITNNGSYTVLVADSSYGGFDGTGTYRLYFAQLPGAFAVPSGDEGGSMSSGGNYDGTIQSGDLDLWSFTGTSGDRIVLRLAQLTYTGYFNPWARIYNPSGVLVADSGSGSSAIADEVTLTLTNNGTYTVLVADSSYGGSDDSGTYRLYFAQLPGAFTVPSGDEGGALSSGGNYDGAIQVGDLDLWSFSAALGDRFVVRMGALTATNYFNPWLRIYNPNGVLVADSGSGSYDGAEELALTATNAGTYTVLASDSDYGSAAGTGAYRLFFAQFPGGMTIPPGDEGGALTSGGSYPGTITVGDLDLWSFTGTTGDRFVVRMAARTFTNYFNPWLRIYGPNGLLIADSGSGNYNGGEELAITATNSGTFTVLATDSGYGGSDGSGDYTLYFAQSRGQFVVPVGDEGGSLTNGVDVLGTILPGDLDLFRFTACKGELVTFRMDALTQTNYFNPWLRLYGPSGVLIADSGSGNFAVSRTIALNVTNAGTFLLLVGDSAYGDVAGSGAYKLTSNGLSDGFKLCWPITSGANSTVTGVGGNANATCVLFTHTDLATPPAAWTPLRTNQFDSFGVASFTNSFSKAESARFFRLRSP